MLHLNSIAIGWNVDTRSKCNKPKEIGLKTREGRRIDETKLFLKKLLIPKTNDTKKIDSAKVWVVSWESRNGKYSPYTKKEFEAFLSKEDTVMFKESINKAFDLVRNTSEMRATISVRGSD